MHQQPTNLESTPENANLKAEGANGSALRIVSLNLGTATMPLRVCEASQSSGKKPMFGGRNTNPAEFELKGDDSETAVEVVALLRRAGKAMKSAEDGPLLIPASEMQVIQDTLALIFKESVEEVQPESNAYIRSLFRYETWAEVLTSVRAMSPCLFNAFNLYTLKLNRPSVWENPASCSKLRNTIDYLIAWKDWYCELDRASQFWLQDAPRVANKRGLEVPVAFAGLLVFDVMCLCTARRSIGCSDTDNALDDIGDGARHVPFKEISRFAESLPASSLKARHALAQQIAQGAHALLAQEARDFADHPTIAAEFLPPICASDGFTAIFLRKGSFSKARDISNAVVKRMEAFSDEGPPELQRAWRTTASRLVAISCECHPQLGGFQVCLVSVHVSKSDYTAGFMETLRVVLADYDADVNVVGLDSNCSSEEVSAFQKRLLNAGFDVGCVPKQQQVTVAKQRTAFQTQTLKVGHVDISHKDYILSWTSPRVRRGRTTYTPDLTTSYGVERETKQCVRLPTTKWPFDHCVVATHFQRRLHFRAKMRCDQHCCGSCGLVLLVLIVLIMPFLRVPRMSMYGTPGRWYHDPFIFTRRTGICEAAPPCPEDWVQYGSSCYTTTPKMSYPDVQSFCERFDGAPITIDSEGENQIAVESLCPTDDFCYIGLLGDFAGRSYWASGATLNYTRLVVVQDSFAAFIPLFENSRNTDYVGTLLSNMPGDVSECDVRYAFTFLGGSATLVDIFRDYVAPMLSLVWTGVLLTQRPPGQQKLLSPTTLLLVNFIVNFQLAVHKLVNACFVDDFSLHLFVFDYGVSSSMGGHTVTSMLGLWMIVRRMCVLYPKGGYKQLFWCIFVSANITIIEINVFIDYMAPLGANWSVLLSVIGCMVASLFHAALAVRSFRHLYFTWACLREEARSGFSTQGPALMEQVGAAKLHLAAVPFAILTGALRWALIGALTVARIWLDFTPVMGNNYYMLCLFLDSLTNDFCAHVFGALNMDAAVVRAKGVTMEVAARAEREVEQHRLAVRMLKAAPTSTEQLQQFAILERKAVDAIGSEQENNAFLILKSAVHVETVRIHRLMDCVRIRAMTMRMRYQCLIDVQTVEGIPRQHVPEKFALGEKSQAIANEYLNWLYNEADAAQEVLFQSLELLLAKFNKTCWPGDLGLPTEEFPWRIWTASDFEVGVKPLPTGDVISPGEVLIHSTPRSGCLARDSATLCVVMEETSSQRAMIHRNGMVCPDEVSRNELRACGGGGVFIPGPQKKRQRSLHKIASDYQESAPWPAAASLVDICRCMILCDDPYAMAVLVAYLRHNMKAVRVKNRFHEDVLESHAPVELQSMFYSAADMVMSDTVTNSTKNTTSNSHNSGFRDISMNVEVMTPGGVPFICEIQVALSNLAILKKADQNLYTIRRMKSPKELLKANVFGQGSGGATELADASG